MTGNEKGRVVTVPDPEIPSLKIIGQPHCEFIVQFSQAPPCAKLRPPLRGQRDFFKPGHRVVLVLQTEAALSLIDPPDDGFLGDLLVARERVGVSLNPHNERMFLISHMARPAELCRAKIFEAFVPPIPRTSASRLNMMANPSSTPSGPGTKIVSSRESVARSKSDTPRASAWNSSLHDSRRSS